MLLQKNMLLAILTITIFVFVVAVSSLYVEMEISSGNACGCAIPIWLFVPLLGSLGLFIGALIYALLRPEERKEEKTKLREAIKNALLTTSKGDERKLMEIILQKESIKQHELVKLSGMNKVKVHRILKRLEARGIIEREREGKIVVVKLKKEILNLNL